VPPIPQAKPIGYDQYPIYEIFHRQAQANLYPQAILDDSPYPLRALILVGCNALVTWPHSTKVKQALQKLTLLVSVDPFPTATGELAHYQLPSSTFAESSTLPSENEARSNLVREQQESWPDWKIFFQLAQGLGMEKYFPWKSFSEALNAPRVYYGDDPQRCIKPIPPENQASRPRFPTRTGKVEIYSELMAQWGAGVPAIPDYLPAGEQPNDQYPLVLLTGRRTQAYINSQFHNIYAVRRQIPEPTVEIHPQTAVRAGLRENSAAWVVSPHGKAIFTVRIQERIHPRIAVIPAGWAQANANLLVSEKLDPVTGFPAFRSGICQVYPLDGMSVLQPLVSQPE
jgi:anaerobic selenocysteine-containing dehydrogenase